MTLQDAVSLLRSAGIDNAFYEVSLLAEAFLGVSSSAFPASLSLDVSDPAFLSAIERRRARYPLQYLLGVWSFWRQEYEVSPDCLIPRPDTELLVEEAIARLPRSSRFADFCTGSGCIAISVLCDRPDLTAVGVDKFPRTLALASRNASRNGVASRFEGLLADLLSPDPLPGAAPFDAILCNPPYIRTSELSSLAPELSAEPVAALDGSPDGLIFYRTLLSNADRFLSPDGFFLFEIGFDQAEDLRSLGLSSGFPVFSVRKDYGGNDRVVFLSRSVREKGEKR